MKLQLIYQGLLDSFRSGVDFDALEVLHERRSERLPVDYFEYYNSVSSVYSAKIEGEEIDFDSFFKHKFLNVSYEPDYTMRSDDLYSAYEFIQKEKISESSIYTAHSLLAAHLLPKMGRGSLRKGPMYVLNEQDRIEYVACDQFKLKSEFTLFLEDVNVLLEATLEIEDCFYYASMIHLVFVKIHPFQDGNGRMGRLLEKWFLIHHLGEVANAVNLEKNYYTKRGDYYDNIRVLGLEYDSLDYGQALSFIQMTIDSLR